ncbi:hypothetical protein PMW_79 [Pseudomonas phage phiPMW]|uniref:Uncharacterized protein n=1 Tax=Pseudomonas phage phiPMW TaxID=1815582 RepID=A0A1S5R1B8_9CAUD|nr:hypothetical protein FDG97_gp079 [Pseudomonas phage phiPMW]ANA49204.1 hypothetical protein PMW_79 [Pseudomonas phage phiPMW]
MLTIQDLLLKEGVQQVEERPTSGRYTQVWVTGINKQKTLWAETIEVDDKGNHYQYTDGADAFLTQTSEPIVDKILFFVGEKL